MIKMKNEFPSFQVKVSCDRQPPQFYGGESFKLTFETTADAYVYVFDCTEEGQVVCLFPNKGQKDNFVKAKRAVTIPPPNANYTIEVGPPYGSEYVKIIASKKKLSSLDQETLQQAVATLVPNPKAMKLLMELKKKENKDWADGTLLIQTADPKKKPNTPNRVPMAKKPRERKHIALNFGLSYYEDRSGFRNPACAKDAKKMAEVMRAKARFEAQVLVNKQATRVQILAALNSLQTKTAPGDIISIYWSGSIHYTKSGNREVGALVPYDAEMTTITGQDRSLITEEQLAKIIAKLRGRQIVCVFETYHYRKSRFGAGSRDLDGIFSELVREVVKTRKGQPNLVLIESCQKSQYPHAHRETQLSVMTHYLASNLEINTKATIGELHRTVADQVENYVKKTYRAEQRPKLLSNGGVNVAIAN